MQLSSSKTPLKLSLKTEIRQQPDAQDAAARYLLAIWVAVRIEILQMSPQIVPTESKEEIGLILRLMRQFGGSTVAEFAEAIRLAAIDKQRDLASGQARFPTLYAADFEEHLQQIAMKKQRAAEQKEALSLPAKVGGNDFWGEPAEALSREWPRIVEQTKLLRSLGNGKMARCRFWYGGSREQQAAAVLVLRQMVWEINEAGKWDLQQHHYDALAIFASEFFQHYPQFAGMTDGMKRPICPIQVADIKSRLQRLVPDTSNFPDIDDCKFSAVFDSYWKFKEGNDDTRPKKQP